MAPEDGAPLGADFLAHEPRVGEREAADRERERGSRCAGRISRKLWSNDSSVWGICWAYWAL